MDDAIPFEHAAPGLPLIVVEGTVGSAGEIRLVLDTGASAPFPVFLSEKLARELDLQLSEPVEVRNSGAVGAAPQSYRTATLDRFTLGPVVLSNVTVAVTPVVDRLSAAVQQDVGAIVGQELLKDRVIAIDYRTGEIDLTADSGIARDAMRFRLGPAKPVILVKAELNERGPFVMEIDTGATVSSVSPQAAERARIRSRGTGRLTGAGGAIDVGVGSARFGFGEIERDLPRVNITEAIGGISAAVGAPMDGILGADFFAGTRLTIDYPGRRLWVDGEER